MDKNKETKKIIFKMLETIQVGDVICFQSKRYKMNLNLAEALSKHGIGYYTVKIK